MIRVLELFAGIGACSKALTNLGIEHWRLMGFDDEDFDRAKAAGISDTQLYKQAGNSIVVDVLMAIFKELLCQKQ